MLGLLAKLFSYGTGHPKKDGASPSPMRDFLARKSTDQAIPLVRQNEVPALTRLRQGDSDRSVAGSATLDAKNLAWREFVWESDVHHDHCHWHAVRWRFYENGLVCFDGRMSNSGSGAHLGDMQGHRIELRERNGFLLGVWSANFYVRKGLPPLGFQASIVDDHIPLKMQFADIHETQSGSWLWK